MTDQISDAQIEALRNIDTPTICNLIEMAAPERRGYGYTVEHLHCIFPEMKPIVGYAKTATMTAKQPSKYTEQDNLLIVKIYRKNFLMKLNPRLNWMTPH